MENINNEIYSVWLDDTGEINDYYMTRQAAQSLADKFIEDGYPATIYIAK